MINLVGKNGKVTELIEDKDGEVLHQSSKPIPTPELQKQINMSEGPLASVSVGMGYTMNLGDFESMKLSVYVTLPSPNDTNDLNAAFHQASAFCEQRLEMLVIKAKSE